LADCTIDTSDVPRDLGSRQLLAGRSLRQFEREHQSLCSSNASTGTPISIGAPHPVTTAHNRRDSKRAGLVLAKDTVTSAVVRARIVVISVIAS
jgi:hypothetical protein